MKWLHKAAGCYVAAIFFLALAAGIVAPYDYATQFRDRTGEPPSAQFLLGTDDLGRDRLSRLLFALRVSLLIAPITAAATAALAGVLGVISGWWGGWLDQAITAASDLLLSLPLLFVVLMLRALLPLNAGAEASIAALALVLIVAGWPTGTRVLRAIVMGLRRDPSVIQARAYGSGELRITGVHLMARLRSPLAAQFWVLIPAFLTAEANVGVLGLGVSEPLPSLGNLLAELRDYHRIAEAPWILAPAGVLVSVLGALHLLVSEAEGRS